MPAQTAAILGERPRARPCGSRDGTRGAGRSRRHGGRHPAERRAREGERHRLRARRARQRHDADLRPAHLRASASACSTAARATASWRRCSSRRRSSRIISRSSASAATRGRRRRRSSRSPASTCSRPAISRAAPTPRSSCSRTRRAASTRSSSSRTTRFKARCCTAIPSTARGTSSCMRDGTQIGDFRENILFGQAHIGDSGTAGADAVTALADTAEICGCNGVCKGDIVKAITKKNLFTLDEVRAHTKASSSCGSCTGLVEQLLANTLGGDYSEAPAKKPMCPCTIYTHEEVRAAILRERLKSIPGGHAVSRVEDAGRLPQVPPRAQLLSAVRVARRVPGRQAVALHQRARARQHPARRHVLRRAAHVGRRHLGEGIARDRRRRREVRRADRQGHGRAAHRSARRQEGGLAERLARSERRGLRLGPRLRQGAAHREDLRRQGVVPVRHAGFDGARHQARAHRPGARGIRTRSSSRCRAARATAPRRRSRISAWCASTPATSCTSAATAASRFARRIFSARSRPKRRSSSIAARTCSSTAKRRVTSSARRRGSSASASRTCASASSTTRRGRKALYARFLESQRYSQTDPWAERAAGSRPRSSRRCVAQPRPELVVVSWVDVGPLTALPERGARCVRIGAMTIAVFRTSTGEVFALRDQCPHRGGPLSQGIVHGTRVTCPLHDWVIDLATGMRHGRRRRLDAHLQRAQSRRPRSSCSSCPRSCSRRRHDEPCARRARTAASAAASSRRARADGSHDVRGDPEHPANFGRMCSKGAALGETLELDGRLLHPEIGGQRASWDEALDCRRRRLRAHDRRARPRLRRVLRLGPAPDRGLLRRQQAHEGLHRQRATSTRTRASAWRPPSRATSARSAPIRCRTTTRISSRPSSSCSWARISRGATRCCSSGSAPRKPRTPKLRVVLIDPRRTQTAEIADPVPAAPPRHRRHAVQRPAELSAPRGCARSRVPRCSHGGVRRRAARARRTARRRSPPWPRLAGSPRTTCSSSTAAFARTPRTVTAFSQGVNQSTSGTDKVNAIINVHLATGRIGKPGMGPFSLTGQPNAMGGREVGGLANQLAAHMDFTPDNVARVARFWNAPRRRCAARASRPSTCSRPSSAAR